MSLIQINTPIFPKGFMKRWTVDGFLKWAVGFVIIGGNFMILVAYMWNPDSLDAVRNPLIERMIDTFKTLFTLLAGYYFTKHIDEQSTANKTGHRVEELQGGNEDFNSRITQLESLVKQVAEEQQLGVSRSSTQAITPESSDLSGTGQNG